MMTLAQTSYSIKLTKNKRTRYKIVISSSASLSVIHAAEELRSYLVRITGAVFDIIVDTSSRGEFEILVGKSKHMDELATDIAWDNLGAEGFTIRTIEKSIIIAGSDIRGALYGVYGFLEEYCGCRFLAEDEIKIPERDELFIPAIEDNTQIPVFEHRDAYNGCYSDGDLYARFKQNGDNGKLTEIHGGKEKYNLFCHSFKTFIPPAEYFRTHPEYFAERDGKRVSDGQPCLSNPDVLEIVIEKVRERLREDPAARIISVSQNDNQTYCQCEKCREIDEYEGSPSGSMIRFVNAVADAIKDEFPDVAVDTLAYQYTRRAPLHVKPRSNVVVRLCAIKCCNAHPLEECGRVYDAYNIPGITFRGDLEAWSKISNRLYVWDYVVNFCHYLSPYPNLYVLQPNIKFYLKNNVKGIFSEGYTASRKDYAELNPLRHYLIAHLMWDPDFDVETGINEFLAGYYGMAAGEIRNYIDLIHSMITPDIHIRMQDHPSDQPYLTMEMCEKAGKIFDRAERLADNETILRRVKKLRLSVRYVELAKIPADDPTRRALAEEFICDVRELGVGEYAEGCPIENREPYILDGTF